ncbi:hypothetical protein D3C73_1381910 [compost metagenome]
MFTGIARHAKILVIAGHLPVGKCLLRRSRPQKADRQQTEQKDENNAIAHGRYNPEVKTNNLSRIFLARLMRLNQNRRIGRYFVKKYKSRS